MISCDIYLDRLSSGQKYYIIREGDAINSRAEKRKSEKIVETRGFVRLFVEVEDTEANSKYLFHATNQWHQTVSATTKALKEVQNRE